MPSKVDDLSSVEQTDWTGHVSWRDRAASAVILRHEVVTTATLAGVATLAAVLRLWRLDAVGYNSDEVVYAGQAAAITGVDDLAPYFPVFRAHPLLFQAVLSLFYRFDTADVVGRAVSAGFGVATVLLVFLLGRSLYDRRVGLVAALLMAVMPYHVVVSRQVLLDGPTTFFSTLTIYLLGRFGMSQRPVWLYAAGGAMGLTLLSKETSVLLIGSAYAFLALTGDLRLRLRDGIASLGIAVGMFAIYPLTPVLAGAPKTGNAYLVWQLFRRPNHGWSFYFTEVPVAIGIGVVAVALLGVWVLRSRRTWRETLLYSTIVVPIVFFELWPVKGFQYLLPIAPPLAVLAARTIVQAPAVRGWGTKTAVVLTTLVAVPTALASWDAIQPPQGSTFLAGTGGVPGGREAGRWIARNTPGGSQMITIGPSMANIVEYYGLRQANGLAVSPNPLHRNPAYDPVPNPDLEVRSNNVQYLVWDAYSAGRSPFFERKLLSYVDRYNGRAVHTETTSVRTSDGQLATEPVIVVYQVHP